MSSYLRNGKPKVNFSSIEPTENAKVEGLCECIKNTFERHGIHKFQNRLAGLNVDEVSVNLETDNRFALGVCLQRSPIPPSCWN